MRRLRQTENRRDRLDAGDLARDGPARVSLLRLLVARQVGARLLPRRPPVGRSEELLRCVVDDVRIVLRDEDRSVPVEAVLQVARRLPVDRLRPGRDDPRLLRPPVVPRDLAAVAPAPEDLRVARVGLCPAALAAARRVPVGRPDRAAGDGARDRDVAVVLLGAVEPVRKAVVGSEAVELGRRLVVLRAPARAAVERDRRTAVVPLDHPPRVVRVDPEVVVVPVPDPPFLERLPAVRGAPRADVQDVHDVRVLRVGEDVRVVPGALDQLAVLGDAGPFLAAVVGPEEAPLLGLDEGEDPLGPRSRDGDADLPDDSFGKPSRELLPRLAAVRRLVKARRRAATLHRPRLPHRLPQGGVENPGIRRVDREVGRAGLLVDEEDAPPRLTAVGRLVDPALGARPPGVPLRGDPHDVCIRRVDDDLRNVCRVGEADVRPGLSRVGRLVDAVPGREVAADARFAGADIDHARVGVGDRYGAD